MLKNSVYLLEYPYKANRKRLIRGFFKLEDYELANDNFLFLNLKLFRLSERDLPPNQQYLSYGPLQNLSFLEQEKKTLKSARFGQIRCYHSTHINKVRISIYSNYYTHCNLFRNQTNVKNVRH